jgi:hypothetical protein
LNDPDVSQSLRKPINPLLKIAVLQGSSAAVQSHIERGRDLDARDEKGRTSLMLAALNLKTAVEHSKIPFALSLSKGERDFGMLTKWEHEKAVHASTGSAVFLRWANGMYPITLCVFKTEKVKSPQNRHGLTPDCRPVRQFA